eukprot:2646577-Heterocapsa_arctica.AAC.1
MAMLALSSRELGTGRLRRPGSPGAGGLQPHRPMRRITPRRALTALAKRHRKRRLGRVADARVRPRHCLTLTDNV